MKITTQKQLESCVKKWQKILRLQDWIIKPDLVKMKDIPNSSFDSLGGIAPNYEHKTAHMYIVHPDDQQHGYLHHSMEQLVVHELLHLHTRCLVEMQPRSGQINEEEQLNEIVSNALVNLYYH